MRRITRLMAFVVVATTAVVAQAAMITRRGCNALARAAFFSMMLVSGAWSTNAAADGVISFTADVYPIIELRCLECHRPGGPGYEKSGLDLRSYDGLMKGTKHGPIVVPGSAFTSNLIAVIDGRADPSLRMPYQRGRMSKCERLVFRFWVSQGARDN